MIGEKARCEPGPEDLILGFVWAVLRQVLAGILLGEGTFEAFEGVGVEKVVWVLGFAWRVVWHYPVRGG